MADHDPRDDEYETVIGHPAAPDAAAGPGDDPEATEPDLPAVPPPAPDAGAVTPGGTLVDGLPAVPEPAAGEERPTFEAPSVEGYVTYDLAAAPAPGAPPGPGGPAAPAPPPEPAPFAPAPPPPVLETPRLQRLDDEPDDEGSRRRRGGPPRGLLVVLAVVVVLAASAGGAYLLTQEDEAPARLVSAASPAESEDEPNEPPASDEPVASEPQPSDEQQPATEEQAPRPALAPWARQVIRIVRRSAPGRQASIRAAQAFSRCDFSDAAFADVRRAIQVRRGMLTALAKVRPPTAAARQAQQLLVQSLRRSIAANEARGAAARAEAASGATGSCSSGQPNDSDRGASAAKAAFVQAFTPLARRAGVRPVQAAQI